MAWSTPRTWVVGEVLTAALANLHVRDQLAFLYDVSEPLYVASAMGAGSVSSAAPGPSNVPGSAFTGLSFTKRHAATSLLVSMTTSAYATGGTGTAGWGFTLNGTEYQTVGRGWYHTVSTHLPYVGGLKVTGLAAATYTVVPRWRWLSGAGVSFTVDANDHMVLEVREVMAK